MFHCHHSKISPTQEVDVSNALDQASGTLTEAGGLHSGREQLLFAQRVSPAGPTEAPALAAASVACAP